MNFNQKTYIIIFGKFNNQYIILDIPPSIVHNLVSE